MKDKKQNDVAIQTDSVCVVYVATVLFVKLITQLSSFNWSQLANHFSQVHQQEWDETKLKCNSLHKEIARLNSELDLRHKESEKLQVENKWLIEKYRETKDKKQNDVAIQTDSVCVVYVATVLLVMRMTQLPHAVA